MEMMLPSRSILSRLAALVGLALLGAQPALATPPPEATRCPEKGQPSSTLRAEYDRAAAAFADAARLFPNAAGESARKSSAETLAARAAHLQGSLSQAHKLSQEPLTGAQIWASADHSYTQARILEDCGMRRAALRQYRDIVWTAYALPGTVALAREGLRRLGHPDITPALHNEGSQDPAELKAAYRAALAQGRSMAEAGQLPAAFGALCNAISHAHKAGALSGRDANDWVAPAFAELGLVAFRQGALDDAQAFTQEAIRREWFGAVGSAAGALYNLGLILEARGDRLAAIEAYHESLRRRPNGTVAARLATLLPGSDQSIVTPRAMLGPFASLAEYCRASAASGCSMDSSPSEVTYECKAQLSERARGIVPPYQSVGLLRTACLFDPKQGRGTHHYRLVVQTAAGMFVSSVIASRFQNRRCESQIESRELALRQIVAGGAPEIVVRLRHTSSCVGQGEDLHDEEQELLLLAGLGPSGQPSATLGIPLLDAQNETRPGRGGSRTQSQASATFLPDGTLRLSAGAAGAPASLSGLLGDHPLRFR